MARLQRQPPSVEVSRVPMLLSWFGCQKLSHSPIFSGEVHLRYHHQGMSGNIPATECVTRDCKWWALLDPNHYKKLVGQLVYLWISRRCTCYSSQPVCVYSEAYAQGWSTTWLFGTFMGQWFPLFVSLTSHIEFQASLRCWMNRLSVYSPILHWLLACSSATLFLDATWNMVSHSSTVAECRGMCPLNKEIVHLWFLLTDFGIPTISATPLLCENSNVIRIANSPMFNKWTKHIEMDCVSTFLLNGLQISSSNLNPLRKRRQIIIVLLIAYELTESRKRGQKRISL